MIRPAVCTVLLFCGSGSFGSSGLRGQSATLQSDIDHALDSARPALLKHLDHANGPHVRTGALALVLLAATHDGIDTREPIYEKAVDRLISARCVQTYDIALRLMVLQLLPNVKERREIATDDVKRLLRHRDDGCFGYSRNTGQWDLSNTQYAALGLRAARAMQVEIKRKVWSDLVRNMLRQQHEDGSFGYQKANSGFPGYASMTAAGIAVLAVCRQALGDRNKYRSSIDAALERSWAYFDVNSAAIGDPETHWCYYFHYGLERAAILCDVEEVGGKSWYETGARMLVDEQLTGGGWRGDEHGEQDRNLPKGLGSAVATSFAVLFLRRKFQKEPGPITPSIVTLPTIGPMSKPKHVQACADELKKRGKAALPEVLKALRSKIENQRRAAAMALTAIAGQDFGYDPALDPADSSRVIRKAELWYLKNR